MPQCVEYVLIIFGHNNYMDIDNFGQVENLLKYDIQRRLATTREILQKAGAHYVIDTFDQLPEVIDPINLHLKDGDSRRRDAFDRKRRLWSSSRHGATCIQD